MRGAFETVERFQGQERALVLASFGVDAAEQIRAEEEFVSPLNRFNVMVSRVRTSLIALLSRRLADRRPREPHVLGGSRLLRHFVDRSLRRSGPIRVWEFRTAEPRLR